MQHATTQHVGQIGSFWLSLRGNSPVWCRTWFDPATRQTRRASLGTADFSNAQLRLAEWVTQNQTLRFEQPENVPLETVLVRYYEGHAKHIPSGEQAFQACRKLSEFFPELLVSELTPDRLDGFTEWMREKGLSDGYISRTLSTLKAALNRAFKRQEIQRVPFIPLPQGGAPRDRRLSLAESAALFDACGSEHLFLYLVLAFGTLARPAALLELQRSQIDFENWLINLNQTGRRQNKKYRPALPMARTLRPWLERVGEQQIIAYHGKPVASIKTSFTAAREKAGLDASVTPYTIRHTMATELRKRGVPPWEVAGMLGHRSAGYRTTEIYAKYDPTYLGKAVEAIDAYFSELDTLTSRSLLNH